MMATVAWLLLLAGAATEPLKAELLSDDVDKATAAAAKLGSERKVEPLLEALALGAPPKVDAAILDALGATGSPRALDALLRYADNRNPELRKRALAALAASADKRAAARLVEALGDVDPTVRAAASRIEAKRKDKGAEERLFLLVQHGDAPAAPALGAVAGPEMTRRLAELVGNLPDALLAQSLGAVLERAEVADPLRVEVVRTLGKIPGPDALSALAEYVASLPAKAERPSKSEAQKILEQKGGGK